jgi:predicted DNA-binding protein with PD1-like motif
MVISDLESTYTGHLENGTTVLYLSEITLLEVKGINLHRVKDDDNIATLTEK